MFTSVLVANRGEIAVRIIRTLRTMGIRSVLVASVPDRQGLAARSADEVVVVEGYSAAETYLDIDAVIAAATKSGCDAVHPGYGFLSERADFAERCAARGLTFVGPSPAVLRALGDKSSARRLATDAGVPVVPGYDGPDDDRSLNEAAAKIGYPLMLKARGGGGGRGMREVRSQDDFAEAVESARREAQAAFGDPGLLLEKLITQAHHVEVQVLADAHGNLVHLGERDCSVQRRRQKLIEESPSPVVDDVLRERLAGDALRIARAANYLNAGTVEFLVGQPGEDGERPSYFLEVNPRLQVEHPVTELRTDLDLVELQLRIAAGERLPFAQDDVVFHGHAIEFRINAEDPWDGFKPSSGRLHDFRMASGRFDTGYEATPPGRGDTVPPHYDSLLAKAVCFGDTREAAISEAQRALRGNGDSGIRLNTELLRRVTHEQAFLDGPATTDWLEANLDEILAAPTTPESDWDEALHRLRTSGSAAWLGAGGRRVWLTDGHEVRELVVAAGTRRLAAAGPGSPAVAPLGLGTPGAQLRVAPPPPLPRRAQATAAGSSVVTAPLAGTIADIRVSEGDRVEAGQLLALLDAMKMEHRIVAPSEGAVARVAVTQGDVVREGDVLVELAE